MKKMGVLVLMLSGCILLNNQVLGQQIIDKRVVYDPALNDCLASFGGLVQSEAVLAFPNSKNRILTTRNLLVKWINEKNESGFYLQEFDSSDFYWQFVETQKYVCAILFVASDLIQPEFYTTLGSGLKTPGKDIYGHDINWSNQGDLFSFVVNKQTKSLDHFENWKFSDRTSSSKWMTKSTQHNLLPKKFIGADQKTSVEISGFYLVRVVNGAKK